MAKRYSGYTEETMEHRATGAGAYFKNYDPKTDTVTKATEAKKLLGATKGGGDVNIKAILRNIEIDGVPGDVKGMVEVDSWEVSMNANLIEVTPDNIKLALGVAKMEDSTTPANYKKITGKNVVAVEDYQDNITFIGTVSGFDEPVIIQIFNVLSTEGLKYGSKDKDDTVIPVSFKGHYAANKLDEPPYAIWVPVKAGAPA